jgi:hypothetical protein
VIRWLVPFNNFKIGKEKANFWFRPHQNPRAPKPWSQKVSKGAQKCHLVTPAPGRKVAARPLYFCIAGGFAGAGHNGWTLIHEPTLKTLSI